MMPLNHQRLPYRHGNTDKQFARKNVAGEK